MIIAHAPRDGTRPAWSPPRATCQMERHRSDIYKVMSKGETRYIKVACGPMGPSSSHDVLDEGQCEPGPEAEHHHKDGQIAEELPGGVPAQRKVLQHLVQGRVGGQRRSPGVMSRHGMGAAHTGAVACTCSTTQDHQREECCLQAQRHAPTLPSHDTALTTLLECPYSLSPLTSDPR